MNSILPVRRLLLPAAALLLCLGGLGGRLFWLQVVEHQKWREKAEHNTQRVFLHESRRGDIVDANGNLLATCVPIKRVYANPRLLGPRYLEVAGVLAPLLGRNETDLIRQLRPTIVGTNSLGRPVTNAYVNLHCKVSQERWQQITQAMVHLTLNLMKSGSTQRLSSAEKIYYRGLRSRAIYAENDYQRVYLSKNLASHVLGFAQEREIEFNDKNVFELVGRDGIEWWFNRKLSGARGWRVTETDSSRHEMAVYREQEVDPMPGLNVVLTIDMVIQGMVEAELAEAMRKHAPVSASAVVVRPSTGEVLAMATLPNYDPNRPGDSPDDHRRNRVIADIFEPGSTFKVVVVSSALNESLVRLPDVFDCEHGRWFYLGRPLRDHGNYGLLTVEQIITKSSNIGAAKIGLRLGEDRLYQYMRSYGFGTNTGITLGGEVRGIVHPPKRWDKLMITRIPMGQSVSVTPIQMVMAMSAIANDGKLMRPMLVKSLRDHNGSVVTQYQPQMVRQVIAPSAARDMVKALKTVVGKGGTARMAELDHYTVAGKTGTAEKVGTNSLGKSVYLDGQYIASFIGFYPADEPEVCILVMLDNPQHGYYGGQVAAPFFKNIAQQVAQYLKLRPDREPEAGEKMAGAAWEGRSSSAPFRVQHTAHALARD